jgi:hypothetical protein
MGTYNKHDLLYVIGCLAASLLDTQLFSSRAQAFLFESYVHGVFLNPRMPAFRVALLT